MQGIRLLALAIPLALTTTLMLLPTQAQELSSIRFNIFGARREITLGSDLGIFANRGLQVEQFTTQSSELQAQQLLDGTWDITGADADNYVYWTQDFDADFFIFMVARGTQDNHFWVSRDIQSWEDLRGKVIAAD